MKTTTAAASFAVLTAWTLVCLFLSTQYVATTERRGAELQHLRARAEEADSETRKYRETLVEIESLKDAVTAMAAGAAATAAATATATDAPAATTAAAVATTDAVTATAPEEKKMTPSEEGEGEVCREGEVCHPAEEGTDAAGEERARDGGGTTAGEGDVASSSGGVAREAGESSGGDGGGGQGGGGGGDEGEVSQLRSGTMGQLGGLRGSHPKPLITRLGCGGNSYGGGGGGGGGSHGGIDIRVVISATSPRREHVQEKLLPALAQFSSPSTDLLISTSDAGLCDTFPSKVVKRLLPIPLNRAAVALNCTTGTRVKPYKPNPFPEDEYDRFLWYWHETVDLVAALAAADHGGRYGLFLEDDVIPTVRTNRVSGLFPESSDPRRQLKAMML